MGWLKKTTHGVNYYDENGTRFRKFIMSHIQIFEQVQTYQDISFDKKNGSKLEISKEDLEEEDDDEMPAPLIIK